MDTTIGKTAGGTLFGEGEPEAQGAPEVQPAAQGGRSLSQIAQEIYANWPQVNFAAKPYLQAMSGMNSINDNYGADDGRSVVLYFLSNARSWTGPVAKQIKLELKNMLNAPRGASTTAGFMDDVTQGIGDVGGVAGDLIKGQPQNLPGDIGGVAGDIGGDLKDAGSYAVHHPAQMATYAGMAALPFILPGAGEAIDAGLIGAGVGEAGAADAAEAGLGATLKGVGQRTLQRGAQNYKNLWNSGANPLSKGDGSLMDAAKGMAKDPFRGGEDTLPGNMNVPQPSVADRLQGIQTGRPNTDMPTQLAPAPGRAQKMVNLAKQTGSMWAGQQALNHIIGGGANTGNWTPSAGGMAYNPSMYSPATPGGVAYQSSVNELTPDEVAERRAWSANYDLFTHLAADDDQSSDLSTQTDGDNITDPKTQGSQEETGDSLDELLKSIGDTGSGNVDAYDDKQNDAIHHFNQNLPTILAFMLSDESGKGHPIIDSVDHMLKEAFPDYKGDDEGDSGDTGDEEKPKVEVIEEKAPKHDDSDKSDEDKRAAKVSVLMGTPSGGISQNPSPVPAPAQGTPSKGMQVQQQQSVAPCALCGGPHPTDQHPSATTPPAQGGQFGTMSKASLLESVAARRPKMCPFHGDLVDYSLTLGDPASARGAVRPSDYGVNYCKSAEFEGKCNFTPAMLTHSYWDERAEQSQQRRQVPQDVGGGDATTPAEFGDAQAVNEPDPGYTPEPRIDVPAEQLTGVGHGTMNNPDTALQMAAKLLREANVIPSGYHLDLSIVRTASIADLGLTEGSRYNMKSDKYDVPDDVTVTKVKPTSIQVVYHFPGGMDSAPQELTEDQLRDQGIHTFEPVGSHIQEQPAPLSDQLDARGQGQPDSAPDAGQVTDLSQSHDGASVEAEFDGQLEGEGEGMQMAAGYREVDGGFFVDQDDNPVDYETYSSTRRMDTPPEMQWLWDDVNKQNRISQREREMQAVVAGRQFSYREQAEFIQEPGKARNSDKLDLSGTHYTEGGGYGTDEVPDEHLWLGI